MLAAERDARLHAFSGPRPLVKHNRAWRHQLWDGRSFEEVVIAPHHAQAAAGAIPAPINAGFASFRRGTARPSRGAFDHGGSSGRASVLLGSGDRRIVAPCAVGAALDRVARLHQSRSRSLSFWRSIGMGRTCVYVHHVDKDAFLKGNIDPDPDELDMVFDLCPSYAELLEQVRKDLNWMDPSDVVEFAGRHNVGFGMHIRWKTMRVNSEQRWLVYKDTVAESLDKALELFAMKTNVPNLLDLNRVSSSIVEAIPATINEEASIEPLSCVYEANEEVNIEHEPLVEANYEHYDDGNVLHDNNLGDLDKYNLQETMDHSIPYSHGYASESDDEGPDEEVDEEGFTAKEAEALTKVLKRDHRTPMFEDLSLADEAVVDGGEGILFGVRPPSHRDTHGKNIILPGSKFETFFELKMWLDEYSVTHYRPHKVVHSNMKLRYTVACEDRGCPWIVRARPWKGGPGWNISEMEEKMIAPVQEGEERKSSVSVVAEVLTKHRPSSKFLKNVGLQPNSTDKSSKSNATVNARVLDLQEQLEMSRQKSEVMREEMDAMKRKATEAEAAQAERDKSYELLLKKAEENDAKYAQLMVLLGAKTGN
ncbi:hypothetical protein D1007_42395 [Hordeum vulgare]|nr:hypothetical protein D1007_42395 [Hordeum vulgare]